MPIDTPQAIFSTGEVEEFLVEDGYEPQTDAFYAERSRRYYAYGNGWVEQPTWDGACNKAT